MTADHEPRGIYESGDSEFAEAESRKHRGQTYPEEKSRKLIGDPRGLVVVDMGCGGSAALAVWIHEMGGEWVGVDVNPMALANHREDYLKNVDDPLEARWIQDDATDLGMNLGMPDWFAGADVVHMRFLLEHVGSDDRDVRAIMNAVDLCKDDGRVIALDYDWRCFEGSEAMNEWVREASGLLRGAGVDLNYGSKLKVKVGRALDLWGVGGEIESNVFKRENCGDPDEFFLVAGATEGLARMLGENEVADRLKVLREKLEDERNSKGLIYTPPEIHAVVVKVRE